MQKRKLLLEVTAPALLAIFLLFFSGTSEVAQVPQSSQPSWGPNTHNFKM
jgi:hypothetical protein